MKAPEYLSLNPMGKVPAIRHGDMVVTECAAICAYLADAFPQAGLAPRPGDRLRGTYYRWMFFAAGPVEAAVTNNALGFVMPEGRERMAGYGSFADVINVLEGAVSRDDYVSFVSITHAFNTTSSMGRLTLNVLLSRWAALRGAASKAEHS
jgi:glutathione S-transferase